MISGLTILENLVLKSITSSNKTVKLCSSSVVSGLVNVRLCGYRTVSVLKVGIVLKMYFKGWNRPENASRLKSL
jgi:hypothetical protein